MDINNTSNTRFFRTAFLYLFLLSIFLITYDKLPFLNYSSYSPSAIFPIFLAFILLFFFGYQHQKYDNWLILFLFISTIHSLFSGVYYGNIATSVKHIFTLIIGFSTFIVFRYAFLKKKDDKLFERIFVISLIIPVTLGFLQLLNQIGLNLNLVNTLTSVFSVNIYERRIQLTSSEPSWAVMHLLSLGVMILFISRKKSKLLFSAMVILFFASLSTLGFGVLAFSFLLYALITKKYRMKMFLLLGIILTVVFVLIPNIIDIFGIQGYYVRRFDPRYLFSHEFLATDGSGFVRIVFPLIGFLQFLDNPFGYGGGFYYVHFTEYLMNHFSFGMHFPEVQYNAFIYPENAASRNLLSKLLSEEGIINLIFFVAFLIGVYKQCKSNYSKFVFCLAISLLLNFDSYAFVDFWMLMGVVASGYFNKEYNNAFKLERGEMLGKAG